MNRLSEVLKVHLVVLLLFIGVFLTYLLRLVPTILGGDSGDLITAAYLLGVAHPPGYPLFTLIGHLFTLIPVGPSIAWKVNLTSAIFEAATIPFVFLTIYFLTQRILIAFFGSVTLAFSYTFWFYGEFAEVFALNNLFAALLLFFAILFERKRKLVYFYLFSLILGLSLAHHQTIILLVPALIPFFFAQRELILNSRVIVKAFFSFFLGLSFYLYIPIAAHFNPPYAWGDPKDFYSVFRVITRADYGTLQATLYFGEAPLGRIHHFLLYWRFFVVDFTFILIILLLLGFATLYNQNKIKFIGFLLAFSFSGFFFQMYANFPLGGPFQIGVIERFLLLSFILAVIIASFGLLTFSNLLVKISKRFLKIKKRVFLLQTLVILPFLLLPITLFVTNFPKTNLSKNFSGKTLAEDILLTPEKNSIVLLGGDTVLFNSWYLHFVEKIRPDLKVIGRSFLFADWYYYKLLPRVYPDLIIPQEGDKAKRVEKFLTENRHLYPIYYSEPVITPVGFSWAPVGFLHKLILEKDLLDQTFIESQNEQVWKNYRIPQIQGYEDLFSDFSRQLYAEARVRNGDYFFNLGNYSKAEKMYQQAVNIAPDFELARLKFGKTLGLGGYCQEGLGQFEVILEKNPNHFLALENISALYLECFKDEKKAEEFNQKAQNAKVKMIKIPTSLERF